MMFNLTFRMDNAAFEDQPATEAARILRDVAARVERGDIPPGDGLPIYDVNGNKVGRWSIAD